jgi:glycosyltransferase involved in cell wall biosynthesis
MTLTFSILTPTLNRRTMLEEAVESVSRQNWPAVEHVVADGGSQDGTVEWLSGRPGVRLLRGPDGGIYDALNRAVAAARGDIIGWLNSDDLYADGAFAAAAAAFGSDPDLMAVCGGAQIERDGRVERAYPAALVADLGPGALLIGPNLPNAWFFRRAAMEAAGAFSPALRFAADNDFMLRFARLRARCAAVPALFYRYRRHEGSATFGTGAVPEALRHDMLKLALAWRDDADAPTRRAARALEGRCRAVLALNAAARGDVAAAAGQLASHAPAIALGFWDYATRRLDPRLRLRRLGRSTP